MAVKCVPFAELPVSNRLELESRLAAFYSSNPQDYYHTADRNAEIYRHDTLPFHMDLLERISPGSSVCELGCGTAHLCPQVEKRGGRYTGLDWSGELLAANAERFPNATFMGADSELPGTYDVVVSLYTLEHVVNPLAYLDRLWAACRVGGIVAVICPDFVDGAGLPPSLLYGSTARRLRTKARRGALLDAVHHIIDLTLLAPLWKLRARNSPAGSFWINLQPRILNDLNYSIDSDAVHLTRLKDILWWFSLNHADILARSDQMAVADAVRRHNCYAAVQKNA